MSLAGAPGARGDLEELNLCPLQAVHTEGSALSLPGTQSGSRCQQQPPPALGRLGRVPCSPSGVLQSLLGLCSTEAGWGGWALGEEWRSCSLFCFALVSPCQQCWWVLASEPLGHLGGGKQPRLSLGLLPLPCHSAPRQHFPLHPSQLGLPAGKRQRSSWLMSTNLGRKPNPNSPKTKRGRSPTQPECCLGEQRALCAGCVARLWILHPRLGWLGRGLRSSLQPCMARGTSC